jgi:hypothetical protein
VKGCRPPELYWFVVAHSGRGWLAITWRDKLRCCKLCLKPPRLACMWPPHFGCYTTGTSPVFRANDRLIGQPPNPSTTSNWIRPVTLAHRHAALWQPAPKPDYTRNSPPPLIATARHPSAPSILCSWPGSNSRLPPPTPAPSPLCQVDEFKDVPTTARPNARVAQTPP